MFNVFGQTWGKLSKYIPLGGKLSKYIPLALPFVPMSSGPGPYGNWQGEAPANWWVPIEAPLSVGGRSQTHTLGRPGEEFATLETGPAGRPDDSDLVRSVAPNCASRVMLDGFLVRSDNAR